MSKIDNIRKGLLLNTWSPSKLCSQNNVCFVITTFEKSNGLKVCNSRSFPGVSCINKNLQARKLPKGKSRSKTFHIRSIDPRLSDAGFGGRIIEKIIKHAKIITEEARRGPILEAIKTLRVMGLGLRQDEKAFKGRVKSM